jgi:hypothetical protein
MSETTITSAIATLNPLLEALEDAYWDCSEIGTKDRVFDLISCIHSELSELAKLSVNDFSLPYECVTLEFGESCSKIQSLYKDVDRCFHRSATAKKLKASLSDSAGLLKFCEL